MSVEITARHMQSMPDIQAYANDRAAEIVTEFPRVEHVHVILDNEKHRYTAEVVIQARNHIRVEAAETSENIRTSLDVAVQKTTRQLRKLRDKIQDHKVVMKQSETERTRGEAS